MNPQPCKKHKLYGLYHDSGANLPFQPSPQPKMPDISISAGDIDKLLVCLNPHKTAGPDKFKPSVLQALHKELASILQLIFQRLIVTGKIPGIWKEANVSPIYKKAKKSEPSNYRPISLTCVLCKILEHSVASSLAKRFTELDIFDEMQHGFWEKRSCETQLIRNWWTIWKHADWQADWSNSFVKLLIKLPMKKFSLNYTIMVSEETLLNG